MLNKTKPKRRLTLIIIIIILVFLVLLSSLNDLKIVKNKVTKIFDFYYSFFELKIHGTIGLLIIFFTIVLAIWIIVNTVGKMNKIRIDANEKGDFMRHPENFK